MMSSCSDSRVVATVYIALHRYSYPHMDRDMASHCTLKDVRSLESPDILDDLEHRPKNSQRLRQPRRPCKDVVTTTTTTIWTGGGGPPDMDLLQQHIIRAAFDFLWHSLLAPPWLHPPSSSTARA